MPKSAFRADHHALVGPVLASARRGGATPQRPRASQCAGFRRNCRYGCREGGEAPARAGRDPAAGGRELEALRIVAQSEAMRLQRRFDRGPPDARRELPAAAAGKVFTSEHAVEMAQVEADRAGVAGPAESTVFTPPTTDEPAPNG